MTSTTCRRSWWQRQALRSEATSMKKEAEGNPQPQACHGEMRPVRLVCFCLRPPALV
jgi:hypothetical protein